MSRPVSWLRYNSVAMRPYGSGSLFRRGKKGIWYYQARAEGEKHGPFSSGSTDKKVAQQELNKLLGKIVRSEIKPHTPKPKKRETVELILLDYIAYAEEMLESAEIIRVVIRKHLVPALGSLRIPNCDVHRLRKYRRDRKSSGASDTTINREISYLRAAFRRALKEGRIGQLPYFPVSKEDNARQGFLDEPDFLRMLDAQDLPLKPFAACAYYAGMRRGELLRLELTDIDLSRRFLEIRKTKNRTPRVVPILDGPMLEWLTWAVENRKPGQTKVFVWEDGDPSPKGISTRGGIRDASGLV
jgi:hypothetical protein